jgi:hypothetical protein
VVLRARDAQKLARAKRAVEEMLERVRRAQSKKDPPFSVSYRHRVATSLDKLILQEAARGNF